MDHGSLPAGTHGIASAVRTSSSLPPFAYAAQIPLRVDVRINLQLKWRGLLHDRESPSFVFRQRSGIEAFLQVSIAGSRASSPHSMIPQPPLELSAVRLRASATIPSQFTDGWEVRLADCCLSRERASSRL
jgi:hypothetical protein